MIGMFLSVFHVVSHLIFTTILRNWYYYYPQLFSDEDTEAEEVI